MGGPPTVGSFSVGQRPALLVARSGWELRREISLTAPQSPWQNAYVERLIGSIRRECLDHVIVLNETGLPRVLKKRRILAQREVRAGALMVVEVTAHSAALDG